MKAFRSSNAKSSVERGSTRDDNIIISSEYFEDTRPSFICSICNQTLSRLTDAGQNNTTFWCRNCSVEFDPESENVRRESKISVPDRNIEPTATSIQTNMADEVEIRHTPEIRGGLAELRKRGLRITSYNTTEKE